MDFSNIISNESVILSLDVSSKEELLREVSGQMEFLLRKSPSPLSKDEIFKAVTAREHQGGFATGKGFVLLHARLESLSELILVIAVLKKPLDFKSADGVPVDIAPFLLIPEDQPNIALRIMAEIIRVLKEDGEKIRHARRRREVTSIFLGRTIDIDEPITAAEIIQQPLCVLSLETSLKEVAHLMDEYNVEAAPVCDKEGIVVGEITTDRLFQIGIPDFFQSLKSVSFISDFDPFEGYYRTEQSAVVAEVMNKDIPLMSLDSTLLEIIFELTVKKRPMVYIVEEGRLKGIIDKSTVLNKIINL